MADSDVEYIVDATRSEVKRWGGESPGYLHLAVVLARRVRAAIDSDRVKIAPFAPPPRAA